MFAGRPELRPGATSWQSVQARKAPVAEDLQGLVRQAADRNPQIVAATADVEAAARAVGGTGWLPYPRVAYTYLPEPVETRVGPNTHRLAVTQMIPSPWTLSAQRDAASARAQGAQRRLEQVTLEVLSDLKVALARLHRLERASKIVAASLGLARRLAVLAVDGPAFDRERARAQVAELEYEHLRLEETKTAARARVAAMIGAPGSQADIPAPGPWPLLPPPDALDPLLVAALRQSPRVGGDDAAILAATSDADAARGRRFPTLSVGVQLMINEPPAGATGPDAGKDALGITIGVDVPLWPGPGEARIRAADAKLERAVALKATTVDALVAGVTDAFYALRNAHRLLRLYDESLLPRAKAALSDTNVGAISGTVRLSAAIEAQASYHRYLLAREQAFADAVAGEARLERLIGRPLAQAGRP